MFDKFLGTNSNIKIYFSRLYFPIGNSTLAYCH